MASTKAFTAQLATVQLLALFYAIKRGEDFRKYRSALEELSKLSDILQETLANTVHVERVAKELSKYQHLFFL